MGLKKINLEKKIKGKYKRQNSFYKRKFGILRKLIQMSNLCKTEILVYIYEKDLRQLYEYKNNDKFNLETVRAIHHQLPQNVLQNANQGNMRSYENEFPTIKMTPYTDADYSTLTQRHLPKDQWKKKLQEIDESVEQLESSSCEIEQ